MLFALRAKAASIRGRLLCGRRHAALAGLALILTACASDEGPDVEQLIDRLKSIDERNRKPAVDQLAAMGRPIVPRLLTEMSSSYTQVRFEVAHLLGRSKDPRAVPVLIAALADKSANVAQTAAWSLGSIRSSQAVPALLAYTDDVSPGVRHQVVWALGACQSDSLAPALVDSAHRAVLHALSDSHPGVREGALLGIREFGLRDAVDQVIALSTDGTPEIRFLVVQMLDQLHKGAFRRTVGDLPQAVRLRIVDALIGLLQDDQASIRTHAIRALGHSGDSRAVAPLTQVQDSGSESDRAEAARALKALGGTQ